MYLNQLHFYLQQQSLHPHQGTSADTDCTNRTYTVTLFEQRNASGYRGLTRRSSSSQLFPELTTIDNFPYKTGKLAAETMIKAIEEDNKQRRILIDPQLVVRNSCRSIM